MIVLGPVPCQGCRKPVVWNGWEWQDPQGYLHRCMARALRERDRARYNGAAEYSGPIAHNAQRPSVRLYSEREGVGFLGVQTR